MDTFIQGTDVRAKLTTTDATDTLFDASEIVVTGRAPDRARIGPFKLSTGEVVKIANTTGLYYVIINAAVASADHDDRPYRLRMVATVGGYSSVQQPTFRVEKDSTA